MSQADCTTGRVQGCEWITSNSTSTTTTTVGNCQLRTPNIPAAYCPQVLSSKCAQTNGCAYVDSKCTHFTGCSAYTKTTTAECQAITYECVSDGERCIQASLCTDYKTQTICESTPSISGILKCKWDTTTNACRDYVCAEADSTLATDDQCGAWLSGCVSRGKGCWSKPLPLCSAYAGDATTCATYIGSDGNCELAAGATNCQAKVCTNAPNTTITDADCKLYQKGCITTGKGCIAATVLPQCSTYQGDISTCIGYIGVDGICEGDAGGTQCRARKCENGTFTTDADCAKYKSGCKTTGKGCIATLGACSSYQGTSTTCAGYIGSDGYCKGVSTTTSGACTPKLCEDAPTTATTDTACAAFQIGCSSTGQGCVKTLPSCQTYTGDASSCASRIGSEGNCTWASGTNCVARTCAGAATTVNTNTACSKWFTNCVTNGAGCVSTTTCDATIKDLSCQGTTNCAWQPICTSNEGCNAFKSVSICAANKGRVFDYNKYTYKADGTTIDTTTPIYKFVNCAWRNGSCYQMECSDLTGTFYATDANCAAALTGCISNKKDACITGYECSKLTGTMDTCKGYSNAYCTNTANASATSACASRQCSDNVDATDTSTCNAWLPGCITNGNGCVDSTTACTSFQGTQTTCNNLFGNYFGNSVQCYNTSAASATDYCIFKTCDLATGKTSDSECASFLTGCVYDGNTSCVVFSTASCASYNSGSDGSYCDKVSIKDKSAKYCYGSAVNSSCKIRECSDNTSATDQAACDSFKSGCIFKFGGGCEDYSNVRCESQQGTLANCPNFFGSLSSATSVKIRCTRVDACQDRLCGDIANPSQATDCTNYKSTCRFVKAGTPCIGATACGSYNVPDSTASNALKFTYCTGITDSTGKTCGFTKDANTCSTRTCDQFLASTYTTSLTCTTYIDSTTSGSGTCKLSGTSCQATKADCTYTVDTTALADTASRLAYCKIFTNDKNVQCTYTGSGAACALQLTCETINTTTDSKVCNDFLPTKLGKCQKGANANCIETAADCATYTVPSTLNNAQKLAFCQSLKAIDNTAKFATGKALFKNCYWVSGANCAYQTCASITSAVSQADCDAQTTGCYYYSGKCYSSVASCPTGFPQGVTTSSQKAMYCMSIYNGTVFCQIKDDQSGCIANVETDCTGLTNPTTAWDGGTGSDALYCTHHQTKDKTKICKAGSTANKCVVGACADVPSPTSQGDCDIYVIGCKYVNNACVAFGTGVAAAGDCATVAKVPFGTEVQAADALEKLAYCQSFYKTDKSIHCTYDVLNSTPPTACVAAAANCSSYGSLPSGTELIYCQSKINVFGVQCTFTTSATACRDYDCSDITAAVKSQIDCDQNSKGQGCQYYKGTCWSAVTGCSKIPASGSTVAEKQSYCEELNSGAKDCTYITGTYCADVQANCSGYDVSAISAVAEKQSTCERVNATTESDCTFIQKDGATACAKLDVCTNYGVTATKEATQCPLVLSSAGYPCKAGTSSNCAALTCPDITTNATDCTKNAAGCVYYQQVCYTKVVCGSYTIPGALTATSAKKSWCEGVTDVNGNLCKWDGTKCADRACGDVTYQSDFDCNAYLKGCKTDGKKCVNPDYTCASSSGDTAFCNLLVDSTGKDKCTPKTTASTDTAACSARSCYDNVTATNDSDCNTFMNGCVTKGTGCIPYTATCDQYRGTKSTCEGFKQYISTDANGVITYQYCSGDAANTATSACKNRVCADFTTAADDTTCKAYLNGCVANGIGCIEETVSCTQFKGTNAQCAKFMGTSGSEYCLGTANDATTVASCKKRLCTDVSATNNKDCYNGMPPLKDNAGKDIFVFCVYDGVRSCVDNNKQCSFFKGNVDTCPLYTATDGPCKATTIGSIVGTCAKRVCTEAPNTLTTDADCQAYHPLCYTTGQGCTTNTSCSYLTNQASCSSRVTCTWTNQCKSAVTTCSAYSNTSQSQCVNTKVAGKYCAWSETGSLCRNQTCADQPGTIKDHATCQAFSETCTTSGAGCVTMTACSYYTVQSVCLAASTTQDGVSRCGWENNACRKRVCGDKSATTTAECDTFLSGCQTNGTTCVAANSCTDFNGNQQYCQKSKTGPCLYVGGICYDYTQCEDAPGKTHAVCQTFSPLCTTNGTNCIPITSCEKTTLKASCVVGTDGACGWLPAGGTNATEKCQKFGACTDAVAATNDVCYAYGPTCVSDGTACIALSTCATYKTQPACNNNGTDGICFWNVTNSVCKLKDCGDATSSNTTNEGCASFSVASGSCTTDGTKCIPLSTCSSYVEVGCVKGTDGVCIFAVAVGVTTGTKTCRLKACEDITGGTTNGACIGISPKKCVSNGTSCITKAACTTYTTKTACNGGGVDSAGNDVTCAFTVTDTTKPNIGTCKQFSQCSDANNDSAACATKQSACQWKATGTTTTCTAYACDTITSGTSCQPVPSFDGLSYTVCNLVNGKCTSADPGTIADTNCYTKSAYTYSWNAANSKCVSCIAGSTTPTNNTTNTNNTNTTTNDTATTYGYLLGAMTLGLLGFMA